MNHDEGVPDAERGLLGRPFVDRPAWPPHAGEPAVQAQPRDDIRPYLMTGGRTRAGGPPVAMETIVVLSNLARRGPVARQAFERARILHECHVPRSVAEVAARLHLPLGVAGVLIADLLADGLLDASAVRWEQAHDIELLERLIAGVSAL